MTEYKTAWAQIAASPELLNKSQREQMQRAAVRQRMTKQSHLIRERFTRYGEIFRAVFGLRTKKRRKTANTIPAHLRPWVPKNQQLTRDGYRQLLIELRQICTESQYHDLVIRYSLEGKAGYAA